MRVINKIKIFSNGLEFSNAIEEELLQLLKMYNFEIVEDGDFDLAIALGGDGSFLKMVKNNNFNSDNYYIGINTGTLGFLQEIKPDRLKVFVDSLNNNDFKVDSIGILETHITTDDSVSRYYSLNELVIRELDLNVFTAGVYVGGHKLETFAGDGLLISTSVGSSAYNTSFRGALIYNTFHALQVTPIAPINSKIYRNLLNPIIVPEKMHIEIYPIKKTILAIFDGENKKYKDVKKIECYVKNKKLKFLRMKDYNFIDIVNEKFLND
ncbi:MAG: NAD(+)/NADH kinase [Bacilli bacterium]|nr:NAD(+)/NADH kinase [Bacilli bacterium]